MQARCRPDAGPILGYAFIAATVGIILRAIQERLGFVGNLIVGANLRRSAVSLYHYGRERRWIRRKRFAASVFTQKIGHHGGPLLGS